MKQIISGLEHISFKGLHGIDGKDGRDGVDGKDGVVIKGLNGKDGKDGKDGMDGRDGLDGIQGKDGSPDTPDEVVEKVNSSEKFIDAERVRGLVSTIREVQRYGTNPQGGSLTFSAAGVTPGSTVRALEMSSTLTYNVDGTVATVTTGVGTKTFNYTSGVLTSITATGGYADKTMNYTGDILTSINATL